MKFCEEYIVDLDAMAAYQRAGFRANSPRSASAAASRMLADPEVSEEIDRLLKMRREGTEAAERVNAAFDELPTKTKAALVRLNASAIINEARLLAFSSIGDFFDFSGPRVRMRTGDEITADSLRTVSSIKLRREVEGYGDDAKEFEIVELKLWDKNAAIGTLAKAFGLLRPRPTLEQVCDALDLHRPGLGTRLKRSLLDGSGVGPADGEPASGEPVDGERADAGGTVCEVPE